MRNQFGILIMCLASLSTVGCFSDGSGGGGKGALPEGVTVTPTVLPAAGGPVTVTATYGASGTLPATVTASAAFGDTIRSGTLTRSGRTFSGTVHLDANASSSGADAVWAITAGGSGSVATAADAVTIAAPALPPAPPSL